MSADAIAEKHQFFRKILDIAPTRIAASRLLKHFPDTDIIVALSAPDAEGELSYLEKVGGPENSARVRACLYLAKIITARRADKTVGEITKTDLLTFSPLVVLSGEPVQIPAMAARAYQEFWLEGWLEQKLVAVECGYRGVANTRTQFDTLNEWLRNQPNGVNREKPVTFVTSDYHVTRVALTAEKRLIQPQPMVVVNADFRAKGLKTWGELRRIRDYNLRDDVADHLTRGRIYCIDWDN